MTTIGDRIRIRREELHMSQEELATKLGYKSRSSVNKIELNGRNLTQSKIKAIADALKTTPSYIMGWDNESITTAPHLSDAELLSEIQAVYGLSTKEAVELFNKLDTMDKGAAIERMRMMLEDKKYLGKEGLLSG